MIKTGKNFSIGNIKISGKGDIIIGDNVQIHDGVEFNVDDTLEIGDRSIIGNNFIIEGRNIKLGREFWSGDYCRIGGGSCHESLSELLVGDFCHFGNFTFINTARKVTIRDEVGLGEATKIYTHGAYLNILEGFPAKFGLVDIGHNVWIPNATILPNSIIGDNVVIAAMSLVNKIIPSGCLAGGIPAKVLKENCYPQKLSSDVIEKMIKDLSTHFIDEILVDTFGPKKIVIDGGSKKRLYVDNCMTLFDFETKRIDGQATAVTEAFKNECRRYGIRFRYYAEDGMYKPWK